MDKISQYLSYNEVTFSTTAVNNRVGNTPTEDHLENLKDYGRFLFDPLRRIVGGPITVTSGYRSRDLNKLVKGARGSQHLFGEALDLKCFSMSTLEFAQTIIRSGLAFDQLILEFHDSKDRGSGWVHLSYKAARNGVNRKEVISAYKTFCARNGRWSTHYRPGLVYSDVPPTEKKE